MTDLDLGERIDRSFGDGPDHRRLERRITAGRRALLRRRLAAGAASVAVVAAFGTAYAVLPTGTEPRTGEVATDPPSSPSSVPWQDDEPVRYRGGELEVRPGVVVHERIDDPFGLEEPRQSVALDLTFEGQRQWVIADAQPDGWGYSSSVPLDDYASFDDWVAEQAGANGDGWPEVLRLTRDGRVVATEGSEVLQRTDDPELGAEFAPAGTATGAAVVRSGDDGVGYFVVWKVVDGELEVSTAVPSEVVGASFDELLSYARGAFRHGEGL